jgi:hypothetical protein
MQTINFNLVLSAFAALLLVAGSLILILRDKSWPVILLLLGSLFTLCSALLFLAQIALGAGRPQVSMTMGFIGIAARLLFCVGFLAYALKRERV